MKITTNWLGDYIDYSWDWRELVERLTMAGLEFEGVDELGQRFDGVVIGHVLECEQHPNADRLSVCKVDVGDTTNIIVCGAPNVAAGQKVAVALPGCTLPGGLKIKRAKIRGVESLGMICAEDELGLGENHDGIMVLNDSLKVGTPFAAATGLDDVVLDFEVTPNRPDCLSLVGIAREIQALTGNALRMPDMGIEESGIASGDAIAINIDAPADCPRYVGRVIRNVKVGPSPDWLQRRLQAVGQRPINNIVDITNFVLLELGQPLHAFDLDKLEQNRIVVRRAKADEKLETLDGIARTLDPDMLVIADGERPVALAGIMGGANSEVDVETTDILLESAHFDASRVRLARTRLGLHTEAAARFERGADWDICLRASNRAAGLIAELTGGTVAPEPLDVYPQSQVCPTIELRIERANKLLATSFNTSTASRILELLGCSVSPAAEKTLQVTVPSFRPDLGRECDLIEELGRIHGYDKIEGSQNANGPWLTERDPNLQWRVQLRRRLADMGLDEVLSNTIVDATWEQLVDAPNAIRLANPPTEAQSLLRSRLLPSLLDIARRNFNQRASSLALFELGKCFSAPASESGLPTESWQLAALYAGPLSDTTWQGSRRDADFFDLKGLLETLIDSTSLRCNAAESAGYRRGHCAQIELTGKNIGYLGQVSPTLCDAFDIEHAVYTFELDFTALVEDIEKRENRFAALPKLPAIERDLSIVVADAVNCDTLVDTMRSGRLVEEVKLFDLYQGDQIEAGHKSLSFSLRLRHPERTLKDTQADAAIEEILTHLQKQFDAHLR
ncbi:MAG: phenylalanyl-tRNA synthetase beta chain [Candidatus Latescibacterota bacterium]|jgi:phenylalanyl-tRNA synthetase beta chain